MGRLPTSDFEKFVIEEGERGGATLYEIGRSDCDSLIARQMLLKRNGISFKVINDASGEIKALLYPYISESSDTPQ